MAWLMRNYKADILAYINQPEISGVKISRRNAISWR